MTKTKKQDTADIGNFTRPGEMDPRMPEVPQDAGVEAIKNFMAGEKLVAVDANAPEVKPSEKHAERKDPKRREAELAAAIQELEASPELTYDQKLEKHGLSREEAMTIIDSMFTKGYFEKEYKVVGTVNVVLRTRKTEDQDRLLQRIEAENPQYPATVSNWVSKYNLAASMQSFHGKDFSKATFKEKYNFVSNLSDTVFRLLCMKLAKFDEMILDVLDEGAIENF